MEIKYKSKKLEKQLTNPRELIKTFGNMAQKIKMRIKNLEDSDNLAVMKTIPAARCHALVGDHKGDFAIDVSGNYRLIFEPNHEPLTMNEDGSLNWESVTKIRINNIEDYH